MELTDIFWEREAAPFEKSGFRLGQSNYDRSETRWRWSETNRRSFPPAESNFSLNRYQLIVQESMLTSTSITFVAMLGGVGIPAELASLQQCSCVFIEFDADMLSSCTTRALLDARTKALDKARGWILLLTGAISWSSLTPSSERFFEMSTGDEPKGRDGPGVKQPSECCLSWMHSLIRRLIAEKVFPAQASSTKESSLNSLPLRYEHRLTDHGFQIFYVRCNNVILSTNIGTPLEKGERKWMECRRNWHQRRVLARCGHFGTVEWYNLTVA